VVTEVKLEPGRRVMLLDVDVARAAKPEGVIAAACGIREESAAADALRFRTCGISGTRAVVCLATNERPRRIAVGGKPLDQTSWQFENGVLALHFENDAAGMDVEILH
jgi:hypothetical protein